jgi:ribosome recycling factor
MEYLKKVAQRFETIIASLGEELLSVRTNRPSPKIIEDIKVDYMGQILTIKQLGSIVIDPPRDLVVNLWDQSITANVVNAIQASNLGINASGQGKQIRVSLPQLTEERKRELIKMTKSISEESRIRMRLERDEAVRIIKDLKDEDERFRAKEELQKLVDKFNSTIEELVENKTKEILA